MTLTLPLPIMAFATTEGLGRTAYNTIRLGQGWAKKLKQDDPVILAHKDRAIAVARVVRAERHRLRDMPPDHWQFNHMGLPQDELIDLLYKTYGPQRVTPDSWLSVVYLQPVKGRHTVDL